jgi:hypothetical protein
MIRIVVDDQTSEKLRSTRETVFVCDAEGRILGHFKPEELDPKRMMPDISEDEVRRRLAEDTGRSLADIFADLQKRS